MRISAAGFSEMPGKTVGQSRGLVDVGSSGALQGFQFVVAMSHTPQVFRILLCTIGRLEGILLRFDFHKPTVITKFLCFVRQHNLHGGERCDFSHVPAPKQTAAWT